MKQLLTLLALIIFGLGAHAQKITQKDLEGSWTLVTYTDESVTLDIKQGIIKLDEELKATFSAEELKEEEESYRDLLEDYKTDVLIFKGKNATHTIAGDVMEGTYTIENFDTTTEIAVISDGEKTVFEVALKNGELHINADEDGLKLIYKKM